MKRLWFTGFLASVLGAGPAIAGDAEGRVAALWASPTNNLVMFSLDDPNADLHRCNTSGRYAIDVLAPGGRATLELLLLAKANDLMLSVESLNSCNAFNAENARFIVVQ
ncbi:MAG: hypothetical protein AAGD86_00340 [Pseudomonadota bacterium]